MGLASCKVDMCYVNIFFSLHPLLIGYETQYWCEMISKKQIMHVAFFLMIYGDCMNILFIIKVKINVLIKWSYRPRQSC